MSIKAPSTNLIIIQYLGKKSQNHYKIIYLNKPPMQSGQYAV